MDISERELMIAVVTLWRSGFIEVTTAPLSAVERDFDAVEVTRCARLQARAYPKVTSRFHESFPLSDDERKAILLVEGSISKQALLASLSRDMSEERARQIVESLAERGFF